MKLEGKKEEEEEWTTKYYKINRHQRYQYNDMDWDLGTYAHNMAQ